MKIFTRMIVPIFAILCGGAHTDEPHATVKNLVNKAAECDGKVSISYHDDGSVEVSFRDIAASRAGATPFIKCQLQGELVIPQGYSIATSQFVDAQFSAHFSKPGDQSGGRFRLELGGAVSSAIALNTAQDDVSDMIITVKSALPVFKTCTQDRVLPLRFTIEAMINYPLDTPSEVASRLDAIRIPTLSLLPSSCNEESL